MEKHGWRAIIYDAPWVKFKPGQNGVIISDDGRSCETINDDISSIEIMLDETATKTENAHILFRQKGSDLFDIVCIS